MAKIIFSSNVVERMAKDLVNVLDFTNRYGYSCGQGDDQVYGCAYKALKNLLIKEFGERATEIAMNSSTWCCSDFENQILPAIKDAITQAEILAIEEKAQKMAAFLMENGCNAWYSSCGNICIFKGKDLEGVEIVDKIGIDWNEVHEYLEEYNG